MKRRGLGWPEMIATFQVGQLVQFKPQQPVLVRGQLNQAYMEDQCLVFKLSECANLRSLALIFHITKTDEIYIPEQLLRTPREANGRFVFTAGPAKITIFPLPAVRHPRGKPVPRVPNFDLRDDHGVLIA